MEFISQENSLNKPYCDTWAAAFEEGLVLKQNYVSSVNLVNNREKRSASPSPNLDNLLRKIIKTK